MTGKKSTTASFGSRPLPDKYVRKDLDDLSSLKTASPLDLHIARLLALHPQLKVQFRNQDLAVLDAMTKQALLDDINDVLGIRPLKKRKA